MAFNKAIHLGTSWATSFSPADLSPALWIEAATSAKFQSNAGSGTAASASTHVVGHISDLSGNGYHLKSVADDTARPTLQGVGGLPYILFDGSNDLIRNATDLGLYAGGSWSLFMAGKISAAAQDRTFFASCCNGANFPFMSPIATSPTPYTEMQTVYRNDANQIVANVAASTSDPLDNTDRVIGFVDSQTAVRGYNNGVAEPSAAYTRSGTFANLNNFCIGGMLRATAGAYCGGRIYGLVIVKRTLTAPEIASLTTYLGNLAGLTL